MEALVRTCAVLGGIIFATTLALRYEQIRLQTIALAQRVSEEQKAANTALAAAKHEADRANEAKTDFLATVSHELRTPLNGVLGSASLLLESSIDAKNRELIQSIHTASEQLKAMIGDILDLSKIEAGQIILDKKSFSLSKLLDDICDITAPVARKKGLDLVFKLPPSVPDTLIGDTVRLRQILLNLVYNALKFTDFGSVIIDVHPITICAETSRLRFDIRDTGIGMTQDTLRHLFEPFSQGIGVEMDQGGTGLGLAICRRLVEAMGGKIAADSNPQRGSVFWFELDFPRSTQETQLNSPLEPFTAAVFIPERHQRDAIAYHLRSFRMPVQLTSKVEELKESSVDVVICKPDAIQAIPTQNPSLKTLIVDDANEAIGKADGYIRPPIRRSELYRKLSVTLGLIESPDSETSDAGRDSQPDFYGHILVVDDNEINRQVLRRMLIHLGATVVLSHDFASAKVALTADTFDLILMDLHMPRTNGFEATGSILNMLECPPPIVAVTASSIVGQKEKCIRAGMSDYLAKPVVITDLAALLDRWIPQAEVQLEIDDSEPTTTGNTGLIDDTIIGALFSQNASRNEGPLGTRLTKLFLDDLESRESHFTIGHKELVSSAHRLRSSAAILGLLPLSNALAEVEDCARAGAPLEGAISQTRALLQPSRDALLAWSTKKAST
jgi:signal transduction histidine kinase/CheY-like chemotaxis protein